MGKTWIKILILVFFAACFTLVLGNLKRIISTTAPDFTVLWIGAKDLLAGSNPYTDASIYTPNAYPPISEVFYLPLGILPYTKALAMFTFLSFASIVGSVVLSLKLVLKKVPWYYFLLFLGASLMSFPTKFSLGMGQINPIVLFLLLLAVFLETKNKSIPAGIILGASIALKPIFVFFLLFFALKKSWKLIFASISTVALLTISTLIFWPIQNWFSWYATAIMPLANFAGRETYLNQGVVSFISRFIGSIDVRIYLNLAATILLIALTIYFAAREKRQNLVLSLFIIVLLLFDTTSWQHHFVWLIFPFITLSGYIFKSKNAILMVLLTLSYLLVSWNFKNPQAFPLILVSNQFYGTLILLGITLFLYHDTYYRRLRLHR